MARTDTPRGSAAPSSAAEEAFQTWEKAIGAWWDQVLESPAFLGAMGRGLSASAQARGTWTRAMSAFLEQAHLPSRDDVIRVARIATLLEERLLAQEDLLLELRDALEEAKREAVQARVDAAEARLEARERLDALQRRLAVLEAGAGQQEDPAAPPPASRRRGREAR